MTSPEALNEDLTRLARVPTLAMIAPAINESITAYSMEVAPSSEKNIRSMRENIGF